MEKLRGLTRNLYRVGIFSNVISPIAGISVLIAYSIANSISPSVQIRQLIKDYFCRQWSDVGHISEVGGGVVQTKQTLVHKQGVNHLLLGLDQNF